MISTADTQQSLPLIMLKPVLVAHSTGDKCGYMKSFGLMAPMASGREQPETHTFKIQVNIEGEALPCVNSEEADDFAMKVVPLF